MGLTIHYTLSVKAEISAAVVREMTQRAANYARKIGCAQVGELMRAVEHPDLASDISPIGSWNDGSFCDVGPKAGWFVTVWPGPGCESAEFGLCQYPRRVRVGRQYVATGYRGGWTFRNFCKTQYAGAHGWDHFLKCHLQIISLLDFWRSLGVRVKVIDEGGFWKRRSERKLREELRQWDCLVAAAGGMFKDECGEAGALVVQSPIYDYKTFERLEHEGRQEFGGQIERLRGKLRGLMRTASNR